jgi:hypothetical protein
MKCVTFSQHFDLDSKGQIKSPSFALSAGNKVTMVSFAMLLRTPANLSQSGIRFGNQWQAGSFAMLPKALCLQVTLLPWFPLVGLTWDWIATLLQSNPRFLSETSDGLLFGDKLANLLLRETRFGDTAGDFTLSTVILSQQ